MRNYVLDWSERLLVLLLFLEFAVSNIRSGDWTNYLLVVTESVSLIFILIRRRALSVSQSPFDWTLAICGTMAPLLTRPGGAALGGYFAAALIILGTTLSIGAKVSLNRRFGLAPANRGVQTGRAYALVRHPMYLGYMIGQVGYLLHNPTASNAAIYVLGWSLLIARVCIEENHLSQDAAYRAYAARVRFRLIPGVF
jgi:protein-S-isoprenylcysteine O-methyltransferase Ste14